MFSRFFQFSSKPACDRSAAAKASAGSPSCSLPDDSSDDSSDSSDDSMGIAFEPRSSRSILPRARTVPSMSGPLRALDASGNDPLSRYPSPRLIHRGRHADILLARDLETASTVVLKAFTLPVFGRPVARATAEQARHELSLLQSVGSPGYAEAAFSDTSSCSETCCPTEPHGRSAHSGSMRSSAAAGGGGSYSYSDPRSGASASSRLGGDNSGSVAAPAVAHALHTFATNQQLYTVLEFCPGVTVIELIANRGGRLSELMCVAEVVHPLLVTLAALHSAGLVHRQIQPEHVLCHQGETCLIDFLHAVDKSTQRLTQRVGTLEYMAPEVLAKPTPDEIFHKVLECGMSEDELPAYDERCDVWSLGVMVYEALTGRQPFLGDTAAEVAAAQVAALVGGDGRMMPELIARHKQLSPAAQDFLSQTLQLSPSCRASAATLLQHPWLKQLVSVAPHTAKADAKRTAGQIKTFLLRSVTAMT